MRTEILKTGDIRVVPETETELFALARLATEAFHLWTERAEADGQETGNYVLLREQKRP